MDERIDVDVLIVGAGTTGIPAAVAAARCGARVLLLGKEPTVGGTIVGSYVAMPCGGPRTGIYREMLDRLAQQHLLTGGTNWFLPSSWLAVMRQMLQAEARISTLCGIGNWRPVLEDRGSRMRVCGLLLPQHEGSESQIRARVTIDATGTGALARAAGCEAMYGREGKLEFGEPHAPEIGDRTVQHCTWMYISQKIGARPAFDMTRLEHVRMGVLVSGVGWFHAHRERALVHDPGIHLHWGCAVQCENTLDPTAIAKAQSEAFAAMEPDMRLLSEHGYAVHLAPRLGIRETQRIVGEHVITENDLRSGQLPVDTIASGTYRLDLWGGDVSPEERHVPCYGIPYRALVPRDVDGLLLAGRIISGTHIASSAYRVQPILATAGQAAGVAAALAARSGAQPRALDAQAVRRVLSGPGQAVSLQAPERR